jgi:hypothetical protein
MRERRRGRFGLIGAVATAAACALASAGCGVFAEEPIVPTATPQDHGNAVQNAGFEDGAEPWHGRELPDWRPFAVSDVRPRTGDLSLSLELSGGAEDQGSRVAGAVQRVASDAFPEFLSGYYYVEDWEHSGVRPYLEFVVSVYGGNHPDGGGLHEARFVIAGAPREPFTLLNGRFIFLSRDDPEPGEWTYFSYPVLETIRTHLGWDPSGWEYVELSLELRYDEKGAGSTASAHVYFDDLYVGPQIFNPNRPPDD